MSTSRWSPENLARAQERLEARTKRGAEGDSVSRDERYHEQAAVVTRFELDPSRHRDLAAAKNLLADSVLVAEDEARQYWSLKSDVRKRVLGRIGSSARLRDVLSSTPGRPGDVLQRVLESWILGTPRPLDEQTATELSATLQTVDWLERTALKHELPDVQDLRRRIDHADLLQPFRDLVGTHFKGRARELGVLRDYLDVAETEAPQLLPLLVYGPGGMGKSTLVSKFILDEIASRSTPIVYLDCDRPGLVAEEPLTLLAEAVRQLGLQFQHLSEPAARLRRAWLQELATSRADVSSALESVALEAVATRDRSGQVRSFALFARELAASSPVLFVIDTFEELQYRSRDFVAELFRFFADIRASLPRVRIIISGRDDVRDFGIEPLPLRELDADAAEGYLELHNVESAELRRVLARSLRGNPLSLRLAARLLQVEPLSPGDLSKLNKVVDDTEIQGILYQRIIDHLHDKDGFIERIAHPGLILRRITADLIRYAIAPACGLAIDSDEQAEDLLNRLRAELALVTNDGDGVRHRADVRRVMLPALRANDKHRAAEIQDAAIKYYGDFDDPASRAEELYHRLLLGQPTTEIDSRWTVPGVEIFLRSALDDLEGEPRSYLASRLGIEVYDDDVGTLEPHVWERTVTNRVEKLIRLDRPEEALVILHERAFRSSGSPLYWMEARVLRQLGRVREARGVARSGVDSVPIERLNAEHLDLCILLAECDESLGGKIDWSAALAIHRRLLEVVANNPRTVRFALAYLRLSERVRWPGALLGELGELSERDELISDALTLLDAMPRTEVATLVNELPHFPEFDRFREEKVVRAARAPDPLQRQSYALAANGNLRRELLDALLDALPTASDVHLLVYEMAERPEVILPPNIGTRGMVFQLVQWAESQGRTGELATAASALNPKALKLQQFLARHGSLVSRRPDIDPFDSHVLEGGRVFLNRAVLRSFMKQLLSNPRDRVLRVVGGRGSGKSATAGFLRYLASATGAFELGVFQLERSWSLEDLVGSIYNVFNWRWAESPSGDNLARLVKQHIDQLLVRTRRSHRTTVLFFDAEESAIRPEVQHFLAALLSAVSNATAPIAVVLCSSTHWAPTAGMVEQLGLLTADDLLRALLQRAPSDAHPELRSWVEEQFPKLGLSGSHNAKVGQLAAALTAYTADRTSPVAVFIGYPAGDRAALEQVVEALRPLTDEHLIRIWSDRELVPGADWRAEVAKRLAESEIVLLVPTYSYLASKEFELLGISTLLERQARGEVTVLSTSFVVNDTLRPRLPEVMDVASEDLVNAARTTAITMRQRRQARHGSLQSVAKATWA